MVWPYYILTILALFLGLSALIAAGANIALANGPRYEDETYKSFLMIDIIIVSLLAILGLILLFYLLFRPTPVL